MIPVNFFSLVGKLKLFGIQMFSFSQRMEKKKKKAAMLGNRVA